MLDIKLTKTSKILIYVAIAALALFIHDHADQYAKAVDMYIAYSQSIN